MNIISTVALGMSALSLILHFIAARTKTKIDDKVADALDVGVQVLHTVEGFKTKE